jgi:hypothetical protein
MLRPQKEKKPPQPGKLKMLGRLGHLGHLTPKPQQNCPFFNLSKLANNKFLGHLARARRPRSAVLCVPCGKKSSSPLRHGCRNPDVTGVTNRDLLSPSSCLLAKKKLVDLVNLDNLTPKIHPRALGGEFSFDRLPS